MDTTKRPPLRTGCSYLYQRTGKEPILSCINIHDESDHTWLISGGNSSESNVFGVKKEYLNKDHNIFKNSVIIDVIDTDTNETNCNALVDIKQWEKSYNNTNESIISEKESPAPLGYQILNCK